MSEEENKEQLDESSVNSNNEYENYDDENYDEYDNTNYLEIDRFFEELLSEYVNRPPPPPPPPLSSIFGQNTYHDYRTSENLFPQVTETSIFVYPYISERRLNNIQLFNDSFIDRLVDRIVDPFESLLNESFEEQSRRSVEKVNDEIDIESFKYNSITKEKEKECCICLDDFTDDDYVSISNCNHLFHTKCIKEWSTYRTTCPVCRENFKQ